VKVAPPAARVRERVIDEDALAGPDAGDEKLPILALLEIVLDRKSVV
jgi:hypothetical protein